jgi:alkylglycerol monooxygenase
MCIHFKKYAAAASKPLLIWIQFAVLLLSVSYLFANIVPIGTSGIFIYVAFVFLFVYAFTDLMDGNKYTFVWDSTKKITGITIIF